MKPPDVAWLAGLMSRLSTTIPAADQVRVATLLADEAPDLTDLQLSAADACAFAGRLDEAVQYLARLDPPDVPERHATSFLVACAPRDATILERLDPSTFALPDAAIQRVIDSLHEIASEGSGRDEVRGSAQALSVVCRIALDRGQIDDSEKAIKAALRVANDLGTEDVETWIEPALRAVQEAKSRIAADTELERMLSEMRRESAAFDRAVSGAASWGSTPPKRFRRNCRTCRKQTSRGISCDECWWTTCESCIGRLDALEALHVREFGSCPECDADIRDHRSEN